MGPSTCAGRGWIRELGWLFLLVVSVPGARAQGNPEWIHQISSVSDGYKSTAPVYGIAILEDGFVASGWGSPVTISESETLPNEGDLRSFIVRLDRDGNREWARRGAYSSERYGALAYATVGDAEDGIVLVSEGIPPVADAGLFTNGGLAVIRYGADGQESWAFSMPESMAGSENPPGFIKGLNVDALGNIYLIGEFVDTLNISGVELIADGSDVFVASLGPDGNLRWLEQIRGPGWEYCSRNHDAIFAADSAGDMYVGCTWSAGTVFGEGQTNEFTLDRDATVVAKFDANGALQWVRTAAAGGALRVEGNVTIEQLATDPDGNLFVSWFYGRVEGETRVVVGDTTLYSPGLAGVFLTKYGPDGALRWFRHIVSSAKAPWGGEQTTSLATDGAGNLFVAGSFQGVVTLDNGERLVAQGTDGFVLAFSPGGKLFWSIHISGPGTEGPTLLSADAAGNLLIAGEFDDDMQIGDVSLSPMGLRDTFLAYYLAGTILAAGDGGLVGDAFGLRIASAYPNPFSRSTTIRFSNDGSPASSVTVFDVLGREVATLDAAGCAADACTFRWDGGDASNGLYFVVSEHGRKEAVSVVLSR